MVYQPQAATTFGDLCSTDQQDGWKHRGGVCEQKTCIEPVLCLESSPVSCFGLFDAPWFLGRQALLSLVCHTLSAKQVVCAGRPKAVFMPRRICQSNKISLSPIHSHEQSTKSSVRLNEKTLQIVFTESLKTHGDPFSFVSFRPHGCAFRTRP